MKVAVGSSHVWGINNAHAIWKKTRLNWEKVAGKLKDISVGKDSVWGVNKKDNIYMRTGESNWRHILGKMKQVSN